jgi:circadian clock protein KaiC
MSTRRRTPAKSPPRGLEKTPTGIAGLDEITRGGLPKGRPSLICGSAGCGKTLFSLEFLAHGAEQHDEPGVFMAFEETEEELAKNFISLGYDLKRLIARKKLLVDYVRVERSEIEETGEYDLEGLFIRLGHAIDSIGAKRVVLDTIEALFGGLPDEGILRAELRRLFRWLKDKGVTALVTGERGRETLTRHGLEEYVADCVILLDHRVYDQISTRRLRIVKYRGSSHGTNEYPFLISSEGISVMPITSLDLDYVSPEARISTGIPRLDAMLGGKGYYRGSSILVSGNAGTGKSSIAAAFAAAAANRGERCLYFAFEESQSQVIRNMRSIGIDLAPAVKSGCLRFHSSRPSQYGLEMHLLAIHDFIRKDRPRVVIIDPVTNLINAGSESEVRSMLTRLIDRLKTDQITSLFTSLTTSSIPGQEDSSVGISSLMDTWLLLRNLESGAERNRGLYILKSRGMAHSNQIREFILSSEGIKLMDVYVGPGEVLTGSARLAQESRELARASIRRQEMERRKREFDRGRLAIEAQIASLRAALDAKADQFKMQQLENLLEDKASAAARVSMAASRRADPFEHINGRARSRQANGVLK